MSGLDFQECCEPYLKGIKEPQSAQKLMRARYSAYVTSHIDFIEQTQTLNDDEEFDRMEATSWSRNSKWLGLEILDTKDGGKDDNKGIVEFIAHFEDKDGKHAHHEVSLFHKIEGKWMFHQSLTPKNRPYVRETKIGRNDPCPCGSQKKYKKCCKP